MTYLLFPVLIHPLLVSRIEFLDGAAALTLACCYWGISVGLLVELWTRRRAESKALAVTAAALFLLAGLGRAFQTATLLELEQPFLWQAVLDFGTILPAIAMLSLRDRYHLLFAPTPEDNPSYPIPQQRYSELKQAIDQRDQELNQQSQHLNAALAELKRTQNQLLQMEKMAMLGQMMSGIAHEIKNPIGFTFGNLTYLEEYVQGLLQVMHAYQATYPEQAPPVRAVCEDVDLDFILEDLPRILDSMKLGVGRVREIVETLRGFYRVDEAEMSAADLHQGVESTLLLLNNRYKGRIEIERTFGDIPFVECYINQINQVFMNLIGNAIDALLEVPSTEREQHHRQIAIATQQEGPNQVSIQISDNGPGITTEVQERLFEPFFTTKPMGVGTGLGLSICHQIVTETHHGQILCCSAPGEGTTFRVKLPIRQSQVSGINAAKNGQKPSLAVPSENAKESIQP